MSKVICNICGTSFPESATQCPICGCVRPADAVTVPENDEEKTGYTYVKGGRFSKANVRKRNQMAAQASGRDRKAPDDEGPSGKKITGLVIVLICLILIIGCFVAYIAFNGFDLFDTNPAQTEPDRIACTSIELALTEFTLDKPGSSAKIELTVYPFNTTDEIIFTSSDKSVVTVSSSGKLEYVGPGEATITVTCGEKSVTCKVICDEIEPVTVPPTETDPPLPEIVLDRVDIVGEDVIAGAFQWPLYDPNKNTDLPVEAITWISDDESVATVDSLGVVYAVGAGVTYIRAEYNGETLATCKITVIDEAKVDGSQEGGTTDPTEPDNTQSTEPSTVTGDLTPYTQYGKTFSEGDNRFSVTLNAGDSVDLFLKDADGNQVSVVWTVKEGDCTLDDDGMGVKVNADETCKLQAEYNGQTYTLIIY